MPATHAPDGWTPLDRELLRGTWATVLLPIADDDTIDLDRISGQLATLTGSGVDGVYVHGTAGEFHTLSEPEYRSVSTLVAQTCRDAGMPFQIGASHMSAHTGRDRAAWARGLWPGAIQVTLPDWLPITVDEARRFLLGIAAVADPVPLVLYNPPHAKTLLTPAELGRLAEEVPSLTGLKVAGGDDEWYRQARERCGSLAVFVPGHHLASGLPRGAAGSYSNVAALHPVGAVRWWQQMQHDPAAALEVEQAIAAFFADHVAPLQRAGFTSPALDKFLAHVGGWSDVGTRVRWPAASVPAAAAEGLREEAQARLPLLLDEPPGRARDDVRWGTATTPR